MSSTGSVTGTSPVGAPQMKGGWPLLGHTTHFVRDTIGLLAKARAECGDVASFNLMGRKVMLFTGPEAQEAVFRADDAILNPNEAYKLMIPIIRQNMKILRHQFEYMADEDEDQTPKFEYLDKFSDLCDYASRMIKVSGEIIARIR